MKSAEYLLREIAPDDLSGVGCYVIDWHFIAADYPQLNRDGVMAYTSPYLARAVQPWLESHNRWTGDGFATIVFRQKIKAWHEVLGIVCHELAHWLTWEPSQLSSQLESLAAVAEYAASDVVPLSPPWSGHESEFIRAAAHLAIRANETVESVTPSRLLFSRPYTGVAESTWITALGKELPSIGSIKVILTTDPPEAFMELWSRFDD